MGNKKNKKKQQPQEESQADRSRRQQREAKRNAEEHEFLDNEIAAEQMKRADAATFPLNVPKDLAFFKKYPKIELHAHLTGSLSPKTISEIVEHDEEKAKNIVSRYRLTEPIDMDKVFHRFKAVEEILDNPDSLRIAVIRTIREFSEDGCLYLELRTTPKKTATMDYEKYIRTVCRAIIEARMLHPHMKIFLIISLNRNMTFDIATEILHYTGVVQQESNVIVGMDLGGDPKLSAFQLLDVLYIARRFHGLGITAHIAEKRTIPNDTTDLLMMKPDRVGHGTFLHTNDHLAQVFGRSNSLLEVCISSNVYTKSYNHPRRSHFAFWKKRGVPIAICTDDKGIFPNASLSEEYYKAADEFNLSLEDLKKINLDALKYSFANKYIATDLSEIRRKIEMHALE
ncbi:hypothetical protein CRE_26208 [Caenorhabditis remanei]|uniref:Uncharacterized protein n=1 Tax=Caenorhabditis remanei TaxID=31234 RepID=E3LQS3_CAERE|nr:hypothetical protein CRE_26208 [Caenorhabditis remanei]